MRTLPRIVGSFVLLLALFYIVSAKSLSWVTPEEREKARVSIPLHKLDGTVTSLQELEDKVVFLNFWATWCGPCRREMPSMERLLKAVGSDDLVMVAVSSDTRQDVLDFSEKMGFTFDFLIDPDDTLSDAMGVPLVPTTLILDRQRRIALAHVGAYEWDSPAAIAGVRKILEE